MSFARLVLSYGGCGSLPVAPGTWGTAGAAITAGLLLQFVGPVSTYWTEVCAVWVVAAVAITVLLTPEIERAGGVDRNRRLAPRPPPPQFPETPLAPPPRLAVPPPTPRPAPRASQPKRGPLETSPA